MNNSKNQQNITQQNHKSKIKWERGLVKSLNKIFGSKEAHRTPGNVNGKITEPDINAPMLWIKTGYGKSNTLEGLLKKAIDKGSGNPYRKKLAVYKKDIGAPTLIAMKFDEFIKLLIESGFGK